LIGANAKQTGNEAFYFIAGESFHYTAGELWFEKPRVAPLPGREARRNDNVITALVKMMSLRYSKWRSEFPHAHIAHQ